MLNEWIDKVQTGDARELIKEIPDESIDLILCDPVYNEIWQYGWLAEVAERVLKPYGSVIAQAGHIHRWEAELVMQNDNLIKRPSLMEVFTGGFTSIWMHKVLRANNNYFWLEKTGINPDRLWVRTMFFGRKDKSHHRWGDGAAGFSYLVQQLTKPEDVVLDPFTGGGTIPSACKLLGRQFIAFEIEPNVAESARKRILETQPPLFILEPEQLDFLPVEEQS